MNKFKLIVNGESVRQLNIDILKDSVYGLEDDTDSFIVLEPKIPIDNGIYLQAICQEDKYIAETRLVFNGADNYKHYSKIYATQEDLFEVFRHYYEDMKSPDIKDWTDDTSNFLEDNTDYDEMIKLYKTDSSKIKYYEVWLNDDNNSLTVHTGIVGDIGVTKEILYNEGKDLPIHIVMKQLVDKQKEIGYQTINLTELIVQYTYDNNTQRHESIIRQKDQIEVLFNEGLGWTGNGHCEGGDAEAGTVNLFCYVVDKDIATETLLNILEEESFSLNLKVAYADDTTEEYVLLYPNKNSHFLI